MDQSQDAPRLRDHWWSRPGWRPGRIMLTWHLTFEHASALHDHVESYQLALHSLPGLNLVPPQWLHLTVQGVGYSDEIDHSTLSAIADAVSSMSAELPAFALTFKHPIIFGEAIAIRPEPAEPLQALLVAIRSAMASVIGAEAVPIGTEQVQGFRPHVSIAYSNTDAEPAPYRAALDSIDKPPTGVLIDRVALIRQERRLAPDWLYRWTTESVAHLRA